jgi:hypothetical protein
VRDGFGAIAAGEQAVVADAVEAFGQDVDEEAADELIDVGRHRGVSARSLDPVVLDLESDLPPVKCEQAAVRDGDTVGVARQIGEHGLGPCKRALGIDEPAFLSHDRAARSQNARSSCACLGHTARHSLTTSTKPAESRRALRSRPSGWNHSEGPLQPRDGDRHAWFPEVSRMAPRQVNVK